MVFSLDGGRRWKIHPLYVTSLMVLSGSSLGVGCDIGRKEDIGEEDGCV